MTFACRQTQKKVLGDSALKYYLMSHLQRLKSIKETFTSPFQNQAKAQNHLNCQ